MVLATATHAEIVQNDYWTKNQNLTNDNLGIRVVGGLIEGTTDEMNHFFHSSHTRVGHTDNYTGYDNVQQVMTVFPECLWNDWTAGANEIYTYEAFLQAVAKFPYFCGETNSPLGYDLAQTCKREIATFFANSYVSSDGWQLTEGGPLGISGNEYGEFSSVFYEGWDSSDILTDDQDRVAEDGYVSLSAAMWKYMTTSLPSPSSHSIMTGFFEPNASDEQA